MIAVRPEEPSDHAAVREVNEAAFGGPAEARLVEQLRSTPECISLVAVAAEGVVGHILFSPVRLDDQPSRGMGLGPMAVVPSLQRGGVGSRLVRSGLEACRDAGVGFVVVLGHPAYYPRFGFVRASSHALRSRYDAPDEAFMVREILPGAIGRGGLVAYHPAFDATV